MKILVFWGGRTACQNCFKTAAAPYSARIPTDAGNAKISKEGKGKNEKEGKEETMTHTHTKRKTKGREAGKRKEPKEGRTKERTTNLEFNSLISH